MFKRNQAVTLMELLITIPMLAIVGVSIAYALSSSSRLTATQIARTKCQIAANNLLTLIKAGKPSAERPALAILADELTLAVDESDEIAGSLRSSSLAMPESDGLTLFVRAWVDSNENNEHGTIAPVFIINVEAVDFSVGSTIKTYFAH